MFKKTKKILNKQPRTKQSLHTPLFKSLCESPRFSGSLNKILRRREMRIFLSLVATFFLLFASYSLAYWERVYPGTYVAGVNISGLKANEAIKLLGKTVTKPDLIIVSVGHKNFEIETAALELDFDYEKSIERAMNIVRTGNYIYDLTQKLTIPFNKIYLGVNISYNTESLDNTLEEITNEISVIPIYPSVQIVEGEIVVDRGKSGTTINKNLAKAEIGNALALNSTSQVQIPIVSIDPSINEEEANILAKRASMLSEKSLTLKFENFTFNLSENDLLILLSSEMEFDKTELEILTNEIAAEISGPPQNPVFVFKGGKVQEFLPAKNGIEIITESLINKIAGNIRHLEESEETTATIDIPVTITPPEFDTKDVNNLGINELIGMGISHYRGSISSRVHNITVASRRFNGVLIAPGKTLSFNGTLGDVSVYTGYQQGYIIKDGATVLGDGGGVCQVSTTLFRAALNAGLPIIERRAHSYRVSYYEQQAPVGLDATVYSPTTDLKIKNDTPEHILVQTTVNPSLASLLFEIYGTSDGRTSTIGKSIFLSTSPPPEDLYTDDPTLPTGVIKQIDHKAWGAKTSFTYFVEKAGEILQNKTFYSNYQPWQAKFLRGTGPQN